MKTFSILSAVLYLLFSTGSFAQTKKTAGPETIKVSGNCSMCKKTIEAAAKSAGATSADWNKESKVLSVSYPSNLTTNARIQQAIATAGYDTESVIANQKAYDSLPDCCQYDRKASAPSTQNKQVGLKDGCCKDDDCCKEKAACCKDQDCCKGKPGLKS